MDRKQYADFIVKRIEACREQARSEFSPSGRIPSFIVDDLLPAEAAIEIFKAFPSKAEMFCRNSLREYKYVAAQMDRYAPVLEEIVYAFQDPRVVRLISEITGLGGLLPDEKLYAGGISLMAQGNFLNPHLDNSHDYERKNYRVLNLLYYVAPDWKEEYGGNLELWDSGPEKPGRTIVSRFNRLAVMMTGQDSWHSVGKVKHAGSRCCISNYYFSPHPAGEKDYFHVTSFRGRPEERLKDLFLQADAKLRNFLRVFFKTGMVKTSHIYRKEK